MFENVSHSVMLNSLGSHGLQPTRILCPWNSPGKNTKGVAIPSSRIKLQPPACRQFLYYLGHQRSHLKCIRSKSDFTNCSQRTDFHKAYSRVNQILLLPGTKSDSFITCMWNLFFLHSFTQYLSSICLYQVSCERLGIQR